MRTHTHKHLRTRNACKCSCTVSQCVSVCVCEFVCLCVLIYAALLLLRFSRFVVVIKGRARAQTFQQQHLNFVGPHTHSYYRVQEKKCIAFASPLDAAQSRSTLAFALASLLFPLSKVTEAQPKTCTQFHTHRHTLRPACRCVCCTAFCVFCGSPYVCMCVCELRVKKRV